MTSVLLISAPRGVANSPHSAFTPHKSVRSTLQETVYVASICPSGSTYEGPGNLTGLNVDRRKHFMNGNYVIGGVGWFLLEFSTGGLV
jgi:hypothetical protein